MKIKEDYVLRSVSGQHVVVPTGEEAINFNGIISLNETGKFLFERLQEGREKETLIQEFQEAYDIDENTAKEDIDDFLRVIRENNLLDE